MYRDSFDSFARNITVISNNNRMHTVAKLRTHTYTHISVSIVSKPPSHIVKTVIIDHRHGLDLLRKLTSIRSCRMPKRANLLSIATLRVVLLDVS